jgi:pyridoxal phosphate enzyme (YggS family)
VRTLYDLGVRHFGENRLHEAGDRLQAAGDEAVWHMVGHVQRRKAKGVVEQFDRVDSVDRVELGAALEKRAAEIGKRIPILAEVNVSGEAAKHGFAPAETAEAVAALREMEHLDIQGLMTMAPLTDDAESVRPYFAELRGMAERLGLPELSMGMSGDYVMAVEEGATQVRIGRALFRA